MKIQQVNYIENGLTQASRPNQITCVANGTKVLFLRKEQAAIVSPMAARLAAGKVVTQFFSDEQNKCDPDQSVQIGFYTKKKARHLLKKFPTVKCVLLPSVNHLGRLYTLHRTTGSGIQTLKYRTIPSAKTPSGFAVVHTIRLQEKVTFTSLQTLKKYLEIVYK